MLSRHRSLFVVEAFVHDFTINFPDELIYIFNEYCFIPLIKFLYYESGIISIDINDKKICHISSDSLWFNKKTYLYSNGQDNDFKIDKICKPLCYIPEISLSLPSSSKICTYSHYDAILCHKYDIDLPSRYQKYASELGYVPSIIIMLLFDSNPKNNFVTTFTSNLLFETKEDKINSYLYCGKQHGIIAGNRFHDIYQLKLGDIKDDDFQFKKLETNNFCKIWKYKDCNVYSKLEMVYLPKNDIIFAIDCIGIHSNYWRYQDTIHDESIQCGLYDLKKNSWTDSVMNLNHTWKDNFKCGIVNSYDDNDIYLISNVGTTMRYNFNKNKWYKLIGHEKKMIFVDESPSIWFDNYNNNILYCVGKQRVNQYPPNDKFKIMYLDIRETDKWKSTFTKWKEIELIYPYRQLDLSQCF